MDLTKQGEVAGVANVDLEDLTLLCERAVEADHLVAPSATDELGSAFGFLPAEAGTPAYFPAQLDVGGSGRLTADELAFAFDEHFDLRADHPSVQLFRNPLLRRKQRIVATALQLLGVPLQLGQRKGESVPYLAVLHQMSSRGVLSD